MLQVVNCALNMTYQEGAMTVVIAEIRAVTSVPTWKVTDRQKGALIHRPRISSHYSDSPMTPSQ